MTILRKPFLLLVLSIGFFACNDDDNNDDVSLIGQYRLTNVNTSIATDLNNDGKESSNQVLETDCYNNFTITLMSDSTYNAVFIGPLLREDEDGNDLQEIICSPNIEEGRYELQGNSIQLFEGDNQEPTNEFTREGKMLKSGDFDAQILTRNSSGQLVYEIGTINFSLEKQ